MNPTLRFMVATLAALVIGLAIVFGAQGQDAHVSPEAIATAEVVDLSPDVVNSAEYRGEPIPEGRGALILKLQVLLDRAGFSPGVIDGIMGSNVSKAIIAAEATAGLPQDGRLDADLWRVLSANAVEEPVLAAYQITPDDSAGPYIPNLPSDYAELAKLERSAFRNAREMLAERFHMDEGLLADLNPGVDFGAPGTRITVAMRGQPKSGPKVAYIIADKSRAQVLGYDAENRLVVSYPATIGSKQLPSPSGIHQVNAIATDAAYYYRPAVNLQQGNNTEPLTIPPGPNNPIGTTWIDLTEPTYGIHGTPEPSKIDKTYSHGCVRLTNWDAEELAALVKKGVTVEFR
ncbi:L,D-transpeptidase [Hyphomonas sp.]|uniref:L,D-transpeptidase family protein n=1 Tax=Alphaproteobacteria TaxID=28211 RepID=UPI0032661A48